LVRDLEKGVGVAQRVQWAVAREVAPAQLSSNVIDAHLEATGQQVLSISTHRLLTAERQWMRVAPLGRSRDDYYVLGQATALPAGALKPFRHNRDCSASPTNCESSTTEAAIAGSQSIESWSCSTIWAPTLVHRP
jgi:hypothetical protein